MILWYVRLGIGLILIALRRRRVGHGTRIGIAPSRYVNFTVARITRHVMTWDVSDLSGYWRRLRRWGRCLLGWGRLLYDWVNI